MGNVVLMLSAHDEGRAGHVQYRKGEDDRVPLEYVTLPGVTNGCIFPNITG